jgi:hypothetical protein
MNGPDPKLRSPAPEILDYLARQPGSQDTIDGILHWWVIDSYIRSWTPKIAKTVARLVEQGFLEEKPSADGKIFYHVSPRHLSILQQRPTGYALHGFVRRPDLTGVPQLTVALYDENGHWIHELGYGCTEEDGYFHMRYQGDPIAPGAAHICVLDRKQTTLYTDKVPLYPQLGQVDYREIVLSVETSLCAPPPPTITFP